MAKQITETLIDDLDGSKADSTVTFGLAGKTYEIDLSRKNARALEKALAPYLDAGRAVRAGRASRGGRSSAAGSPRRSTADIRTWARKNGWPKIGDRGRIPLEVEDAFNAAQ